MIVTHPVIKGTGIHILQIHHVIQDMICRRFWNNCPLLFVASSAHVLRGLIKRVIFRVKQFIIGNFGFRQCVNHIHYVCCIWSTTFRHWRLDPGLLCADVYAQGYYAWGLIGTGTFRCWDLLQKNFFWKIQNFLIFFGKFNDVSF